MIEILNYTTKNPLQIIGECSGICWNSDINNKDKNIKRALDCIDSGHGRSAEYADVYCIIDGYSARCIRELYTHIVGTTRLQESTRYVNENNFSYYTPPSILQDEDSYGLYADCMKYIKEVYKKLIDNNIPKEDVANILPLGMNTKIVWKINLRALIHFFNMRMCNRAYKEIRDLCHELSKELKAYSDEWNLIGSKYFVPKCTANEGRCTEKNSCKK